MRHFCDTLCDIFATHLVTGNVDVLETVVALPEEDEKPAALGEAVEAGDLDEANEEGGA